MNFRFGVENKAGLEILGKYKLNEIYNEDSYLAIKNIPDKSIDCIYTDIPYLYSDCSDGSCSSDITKRIKKVFNEDLKYIKNGIDYSIFEDFKRIMKKVNIFIWCSKLQIPYILKYWVEKDYNFEILVWCKTNPIPATNNVWLSDVEYCLYFRERGVKLNDGYDLKSKWFISSINKEDKDFFNHPTIKPLELVKRHLLHSTKENDIVADFFLGSGTTCVASKELNRRFIGFEINKEYFEIAKDRLNGVTVKDRKLINEGQLALF